MSRKKVDRPSSSERELSLLEKIEAGGEVIVSLSDVSCPICLCILVEPVEMPCHHVICSPCFQETLKHANISCPVCRTRLSSWARKATKQKNLVNKTIWDYIKENFTLQVESRLAGEDITDADEILPCVPHHQFAEEGEIKSEFEAALSKEEQERLKIAKEEFEKSKDLISRFKEEYELDRRQELDDEQFALMVQNTPSPGKENRFLKKKNSVKGPLDSFLSSSQNMNSSQGSISSLHSPGSSQTMNEGKSNSKGKTLFSPSNIRSFLVENKMQSQSPSSPLAQRSDNLESDSQKEKNLNSPISSTQTFDSSLCLELEDSPLLFKVSTNTLLQHLESPNTSKSKGTQFEDEKGEKEKPGAAIEPEKVKVLDDSATKEIECADAENKIKISNEDEEMKGEKSKCSIIDDDEKDMFENESENLLRDEDDIIEKNKSVDVKRNDFSIQDDSDEIDDQNDDEPIVGNGRVSETSDKDVHKPIVGHGITGNVANVNNKNDFDEPVAGTSGASAVKPSFNESQSEDTSELKTISSQSLKSFLGISDVDPSFMEEQLLIAKQIEQEKKDLEIALKLQSELNKEGRSVDRRKGSENGYSFRAATPKSAAASSKKRRRNSSDGKKSKTKDKNQMSIKDSFKRTKLSFQESEEL